MLHDCGECHQAWKTAPGSPAFCCVPISPDMSIATSTCQHLCVFEIANTAFLHVQALSWIDELEAIGLDSAGYKYMTGGRAIGRAAAEAIGETQMPNVTDLKQTFTEKLSWFESALAKHDGPYLLGDTFSMLDIMCISFMERLAAGGVPAWGGVKAQGGAANPVYF